ncbi:28S ribosomal protein S15, mitochondrial [Oratosquilla oratoria]|uniref:28S ribosomal protein S15, mitochondrial n=1 Tax=Oratosquilla oratoria TaxID=337810 RepID=UPI003F76BBA2
MLSVQLLRNTRILCTSIRGSFTPVNGVAWRDRGNIPNIVSGFDQRRNYAMRLELTEYGIIWRRPTYVPSWKPEKSGDLKRNETLDLSAPVQDLQVVKEKIDGVDEITKRLLSLEFAPAKQRNKALKTQVRKAISRHKHDVGSLEVQIAHLTVEIRNLQKKMEECKKNIHLKVNLHETIDRRKKLLRHLRRMDYKRFEWLLNELNILYRPSPRYIRWITRKASLKKLVRMKAHEIREAKLKTYKAKLEAQKAPFLKEKEETYKWIAETEKSLGVPVTVPVEKVEGKC